MGLKGGDAILSFNKEGSADILDYLYYNAQDKFTLTVLTEEGETVDIDIEKYPEESLGLEFDDGAHISPRKCANKCIFCFVDQLPPDARKTLKIKDDDYRLSFAVGNYITLTNLTNYDIRRIIKMKLSPLYVSVHATDPAVRRYMLGNEKAGDISDKIKTLTEGGIIMHCQIVLCPEVNDNGVLENTLKDLYKFYPRLKSVAVVPVGLTAHRENLPRLAPVTREDAIKAIEICSPYEGFACCSDEMYLLADIPLPPYESYGEFEQIENGVGLMRKFEHEFYRSFSEDVIPAKRQVAVVCGTSAYGFIKKLTGDFCRKYGLSGAKVFPVKNRYFGECVTVSGLVCGGDIAKQLKGKTEGWEVIIPRCMLKEFDNVFLDGMDLITLEKELKADITVCEVTGYDYFDALAGARLHSL